MPGILCRYGREKIGEYMRNQLQEDELSDQIGLCKYFDVFTGGTEKKGKEKAALAAAHE